MIEATKTTTREENAANVNVNANDVVDVDVDVDVDETNTNTNSNSNSNSNSKNTISNWDVAFYFICGLLADALPGFFFSTTIIHALNIPNGNPTILSLCSSIGGVLGNIISTFVLTKLNPKPRVIINAVIQMIGILLSWLLSYPFNVVFGTGILTIGFQGMLATIMPLSNYAGGMATRSYQVGFSAAPVLGITLVEIGTAAGLGKNGFFGMALGLPILNAVSFFFLDQTVWKKKNNITTSKATATATATSAASGTSDIDNTGNSSNAVVADDLGKVNDAIEGQEQHNYTIEEQEKRRSSVSLFVEDNLKNSSITESMSAKDYVKATKEIACRYLTLYFVNFAINRFWFDAVYQPSFVSSSATYHGLDQEEAINTSDNVLLSSHIGVFVIGLTIFTCLGTIIPQNISPYWLWIPNVCQAILLSVVLSGVAYGEFPPLSVGAVYIITTLMWMFMFTVYLYTPLFVRNDETLTPRYVEFHQQALIITTSLTYLLVDFISSVWWSESILTKCITSYEDTYNNNTSCTFFN